MSFIGILYNIFAKKSRTIFKESRAQRAWGKARGAWRVGGIGLRYGNEFGSGLDVDGTIGRGIG